VWIPQLAGHESQAEKALAAAPLAAVISTTFMPFAAQIDRMARWLKERRPDVAVIAGGIQVWKSYRHRLRLLDGSMAPDIADAVSEHNYLMDDARPSPVDFLVISARGEESLVRLLESLDSGKDGRGVPNTARFVNGQWELAPIADEAYRETSVDWGGFAVPGKRCYIPVAAGQGCDFQCAFCDFPGLRRRRERSIDSIIAEIRTIPESEDGRRVFFTDDNLFVTRQRAREVCGALIAGGMALHWRGMVRLPVVDREIADLMARSGCREVLLGIESGDPELRRRMGKPSAPRDILAGIELLNRNGIHTKSTFIVGFPGETESSIRNTVDLLNAYPTTGPAGNRYLLFTFAVLPLAPVASRESRRASGLRGYGFHWKHATMSSEEATQWLSRMQDMLKPELSPNYVLEVPDVPGLTGEGIKRAYLLRNLIARRRRGLASGENEAVLWDRLEEVFAGGVSSRIPRGGPGSCPFPQRAHRSTAGPGAA
jgi:p-methyltransferase